MAKKKGFITFSPNLAKKIGPMCHNFFIANLLNLAFACHLESIKEKRKERVRERERKRERECLCLSVSKTFVFDQSYSTVSSINLFTGVNYAQANVFIIAFHFHP